MISSCIPSVQVETLVDDQILALTILDSTRETIDCFAHLVHEDGQQRSQQGAKILYSLYDFSHTLSGINTPYGRSKMNEMKHWKLSERSYVAVVMPNTVLMQISRIMVNSLARDDSSIRLCLSHAEALNWLKAMLAKTN